MATGPIDHRLIAGVEDERETFHARDVIYGGATDQDRSREHQSLTVEWRAAAKSVTADIAVRRDRFSRFKDATSLRASVLGELGGGFARRGRLRRRNRATDILRPLRILPRQFRWQSVA